MGFEDSTINIALDGWIILKLLLNTALRCKLDSCDYRVEQPLVNTVINLWVVKGGKFCGLGEGRLTLPSVEAE